MATPKTLEKTESPPISEVIVQGFKSLSRPDPYEIEIRPLTLLAGANSSGKSSALQPLLLFKQTLEASFDPGPLLLSGPHVRFTSTRQMLPVAWRGEMALGLTLDGQGSVTSHFLATGDDEINLSRTVSSNSKYGRVELEGSSSTVLIEGQERLLRSNRCFRQATTLATRGIWSDAPPYDYSEFSHAIQRILHIPGLRGNPERSYPTTGVGAMFPGTFETYAASIVHDWKKKGSERLEFLGRDLDRLGLTWTVEPWQLDATRVELRVGRLPNPDRSEDLVNIADVGFGVSQTLPVVVALLAAEPGQLVLLEQPEIHLHPRAQVALAELLAEAAQRRVRVVVETHSALLLLALQALVAEDRLASDDVLLHWFQRDDEGVTQIASTTLDGQGAYGDWPEDFGEVTLQAEGRYLNAVEERLIRSGGG